MSIEFQSTSPVWGMTKPKTASMASSEFQSTSPVWGMTIPINLSLCSIHISIHIPRVGDDAHGGYYGLWIEIFQSTSPVWGMTIYYSKIARQNQGFQSTSPVWGMTATLHGGIPFCAAYFYILCPFFWAYRPSFLFPYWIFFPDLPVFLRESPYDFLFAWGSRGFFTGSGLRSDRSWAWHRCA